MTLSEKMIRYRAKNKIGQREFAEKCGLSVQTICSIETEKQIPTKITEAKIMLVIETDEEFKEKKEEEEI